MQVQDIASSHASGVPPTVRVVLRERRPLLDGVIGLFVAAVLAAVVYIAAAVGRVDARLAKPRASRPADSVSDADVDLAWRHRNQRATVTPVRVRTAKESDQIEQVVQRKRALMNPAITVPVRLRDGDECRWCGIVTWWGTRGRTSVRSGAYDHVRAGEVVSVETTVVACASCVAKRRDPRRGQLMPLVPAPAVPFYSAATVAWLESSEWRREQGLPVPAVSPPRNPGTTSRGTDGQAAG